MSIDDSILWRRTDHMIFPLLPKAAGTTCRRAMFVDESLWGTLKADDNDDDFAERLGYLEADLEVFITSRTIDPKYLFLLYPAGDAVWEIRSVRDLPSIRVLGLFAKKDVFIATHFALRETLGGWQSREWKIIKRSARARWRALFHPYEPIVTTNVHDVVSGALNGKYFKG